MADDITIDLGMDPATYLAGAQQITGANTALQQSFGSLAVQTGLVQRVIDSASPKRATLLAWGGMAVAAAQTEQALSGLAAQATVTGANTERLAGGMRKLARDMPLGNQGARQIVEQVTKMGVATAGSEKQVAQLATSVGKLAGATGEGPTQLAAGMVELSRATGNTNLDPKRFNALGDSLTTVSAKSGASATGILAFSKSIAPMAQAAGIGATGVLGISSAFSKMGEDGVGASTAVNKMLTDMSRSVRDGTPEMATYAQIVGKTSEQFERLFKANPTEAITQVTEALAKSGDAPRQLEMLGLDGVRTARSLTALSAQGGLRSAVATATGAYGNGSTDKAAAAAYGGLNDSLVELRASSEQLADAFGRPLLGPLTAFANALKVPINVARSVTESGPVQKGLQALAYAGLAFAGARALLGPLSAAGLTRQALTSTPLRSLAAGYTAGRGIPAAGEGSTFLSRYGAGSRAAADAGNLGNVGRRFWDYGLGAGRGMGPATPGPGGGYGVGDRLRMGLGGAATLAQANMRMITGSLYNGSTNNLDLRRAVGMGMNATPWRGFGNELRGVWSAKDSLPMSSMSQAGPGVDNAARAWGAANPAANAMFRRGVQGGVQMDTSGLSAKGLSGAGAALESFQKRLLMAGESTNVFGRTALAAANMGLASGRMSGRLVGDAAGLAMRGGRALLGSVGGAAGVAGMAVTGLAMAGSKSIQSRKDEENEFYNRDISSTLNTYRDSIGKATGPAVTHASMNETLGKNLAAATVTMQQALKVTAEDRAVAGTGKSRRTYTGSDAGSIASQVRMINPTGLAPDEMQAVKVDLLRQYKDPKMVERILGQVGTSQGRMITGSGGADYANALKVDPNAQGSGGFAKFLRGTGLNDASIEKYDNSLRGPGWLQSFTGATAAGGVFSKNSLNTNQQETIKAASDAMQQRYAAQSTTYGADYAEQERIKGAKEMLEAAKKTGNADVFRQVSKQVTGDLTGKEGGYELRTDQIGDLGKTLASMDKTWGKGYAELEQKRKAAGGDIDAAEIQSAVSKNLATVSPMMSKLFDARQGGAANNAVAASLAAPGNVGLLDKAASAMVANAQKTGTSMQQLGEQAVAAANNLSEASQEFAIVKAAQARAEMKMARDQVSMAPSAVMGQQYAYQTTLATQDAKNPTQQAEKRQAQQNLLSMDQQNQQRLVARLQAQREYEVQVTRTEEDAAKSRAYSIADFGKQVKRTEEDANLQRARSAEDFHRSQARAEQDYGIQRRNQLRDFNISMARAEQDYFKSRSRAIRDFNISMKRMVEDAARSMYDPYTRIQTKATWDAKNLMVNLAEQNAAMAKQKAQLDQLRKMGLSAQSIDQLGLGKAENAQQLNNLSQDAMTDPKVIAQLNELAKERAKVAAGLVNDDSNVEGKRAKEDFAKSMADMATDMKTSVDRAKADLKKSMKDQEEAFTRSMQRSASDFMRSMSRSAADLARNMGRMESDQAISLDRQRDALKVGLTRMGEDIKRSDEVISGNMSDLSEAVQKAMSGKTKTYQKFVSNDTKAFVTQMQSEVLPAMRKVAAELGIDLPKSGGGGGRVTSGRIIVDGKATNVGMMADGGRVPGYSPHARADNIPIMATAGEYMHPVDTVQHYGADTMDAIRAKRVPKEALQGFADGGLIGFAKHIKNMGYAVSEHPLFGGVHPVHTNGSQHYNKRGPGGGGAIDVNADPFNSPFKNEKAAIDKIIGLAREYGLRTIWQAAGHFDHAHFDISKGADMMPVGYKPNATNPGMSAGGKGLDIARVMAGIDKKRGGWYGAMRDMVTAQLEAAYTDVVGGPGDTGAHGKGAKANQAIARRMLKQFGWGDSQMDPLIKLWNGESGWNERADNPTSDAYGIPQSLPGSKMASEGADWRTNPETQIRWGLKYIKSRPDYGTPAAAWAKWQSRSPHWYDKGGWLQPGQTKAQNDTGKPEAVLTDEQWSGIHKLSELAATLLTQEQGRGLAAANSTHMTVNNNQHYAYDNRTDFTGSSITVQADDPDAMGKKLERKEWASRIGQTRSVRRSS